MTQEKTAIVVTSIAEPNAALQALARGCRERGHAFIVIGDESSPNELFTRRLRFLRSAAAARTRIETRKLVSDASLRAQEPWVPVGNAHRRDADYRN